MPDNPASCASVASGPADVGVNPADVAADLDPWTSVDCAAHAGCLLMTSTLVKAGVPLPEGGIKKLIQLVTCGAGDAKLPVSSWLMDL